jgi:hypothetical protein
MAAKADATRASHQSFQSSSPRRGIAAIGEHMVRYLQSLAGCVADCHFGSAGGVQGRMNCGGHAVVAGRVCRPVAQAPGRSWGALIINFISAAAAVE